MKRKSKGSLALLLAGTLLAGLLPVGTGITGKAAEQPALRNPRFLKTTQEVAPGTSEKKELKNPTMENGVTTWDCIWFGNYWQEDTNGDGKADKNDEKTPIKWRVLSVEGDDVFLLADKNLDVQRYNDTETDVTWETCTMRSWLNGYGAEKNKDGKDYSDNNFLINAFSEAEQLAIKTTNVVNEDNPKYETEGGNDTPDKVYLLSIGEVTNPQYGFNSSSSALAAESRRALNTAFARIDMSGTYAVNGLWWLRSPGHGSNYASSVYYDGSVDPSGSYGIHVNYYANAARPALHLNLSSLSSWSYAGTVTSDKDAEDPETPTPTASPVPTEPGNTQKPQETLEPGKTSQPGTTEEPSVTLTPTEPGNTQKPQETLEPGKTPQPGTPSIPQPGASVTPAPGTPSDPGKTKTAVGKVSSLKLKQKKRTVTASWKKTAGAKGYQICYSTSKKWKSKKQKLVGKNKAVIKNLKKKKTYYFRVRAYRLEGTKKVYGAWSSVKKIKIKK